MRLRTKFVLVLMAVLMLLTAANVGGLALYQSDVVGEERANVQETANLTAEQIEKTVNVRKDRVGIVGQKYPHDDLDGSAPYVGTVLNNSQHFVIATVMADNGTVVRAVGNRWTEEGRTRELGTNYSDAAWFEASRNGRIFVEQQGTSIVAISGPLYGSDGQVVGVMKIGVDIDALSFFSVLRPLETDQQTVLVEDESGASLRAPQNEFDSTINGSAEVESLGWEVTVSRDRSRLDGRLQDLALLQGLSLLVVFGSVIGFGVWEYRANLSQTERLLDAFVRIREGNYGYRLALESAAEWRQISDGFNDLARGLAFREAQLLEREQRLGVLNRVLRHNVRNEMSVILNYAQLIKETTTDDQAGTAADTIVDAGHKLTDLSEKARQIEEALDSAERGLVEQELVGLVEGVVESARQDYPGAEIVFDGPREMTAAAIPSLKMALDDVVENAIEHNDREMPRVEIALGERVRDGEEHVVVKVADDGPGIPDQEKAVLVQGRETALEHGSGLGLWLVYWIVDKSDGTLRFDENDPRGSIVTMELHATVPEDITPSAPIGTGDDPELTGADEDASPTDAPVR